MQLAKILKHVPGEDLNGDGVVDENETRICRIAKGKEIYAENFVRDFPGIRNFWKPYRLVLNISLSFLVVTLIPSLPLSAMQVSQ